MKRRLLTLLLTLVFCVTSVAPGFAMNADDLGGAVPAAAAVTQMSATDKISAMEKMLYGTEQAGALVGRMDSLEDDVYGTVNSTLLNGSLMKVCPVVLPRPVSRQ